MKGVLSPEDAGEAVAAGADAVVVSNHGGRQLDRSPPPLDELPGVVRAVGGRAEVYVDGGVLSGGDAVAALCLGATAVLIGRAYLYGLMAGGKAGVGRVLDILSAEIRQTMQLLGVCSTAELARDRARLQAASGCRTAVAGRRWGVLSPGRRGHGLACAQARGSRGASTAVRATSVSRWLVLRA